MKVLVYLTFLLCLNIQAICQINFGTYSKIERKAFTTINLETPNCFKLECMTNYWGIIYFEGNWRISGDTLMVELEVGKNLDQVSQYYLIKKNRLQGPFLNPKVVSEKRRKQGLGPQGNYFYRKKYNR